MVPPLLVLTLTMLVLLVTTPGRCCRLSEFACRNGRCVPSGRYCDGNDDCGDLSDEPPACTNCNRTFSAEANVKNPLRMSSPYQRPLPFVCSMTFVAAGGQYGDLVQLTFLSFQIGALEMDNDSRPACLKGHLQIVEPPALTNALLSQQTRGFTQILSALKQPPSDRLTSLFVTRGNPEFGRLCGDMVGKGATFYTGGSNVTLKVVVPALHPFSFSLYLTYKFLLKRDLKTPRPMVSNSNINNHYYYGNKLTNTYCDHVLVNCDRKHCAIRSPNFPGFYLRNITCHYFIRQEQVPHGRRAHIVLSQDNEYKISLYTGRSSPLSYPHVSLTEECHGDVIRVYDGPSTASPLLVQFCGAGTLTEVISSSPEILVQLYSAPSQVMHNSFAEIEVRVRFTDAAEDAAYSYHHPSTSASLCDLELDGSKRRSGLLFSPRHTVPRNATCTFRLRGATPHDRVWLYFLSYYVEDRHPWSRRETCEVGSLEIYEPTTKRSLRRVKRADDRLISKRQLGSIYDGRFTRKRRKPVSTLLATEEEDATSGIELDSQHVSESICEPRCNQIRTLVTGEEEGTGHNRLGRPRSTRSRRDAAASLLVTGDVDEEQVTGDDRLVSHRKPEPAEQPPSYRFCEKTFPRVCARAADNAPDYVPVRPCRVPAESYLSRGPLLLIRYKTYTTPELLPAWSSSFTLRYEFVDTRQSGTPLGTTATDCDRRFHSGVGSVASPHNVFLFGRGGSRNVSCRYEFVGSPGERISLTFTDIRLRRMNESCEHRYDPTVQRHTCIRRNNDGKEEEGAALVTVVERAGLSSTTTPLACFCAMRSDPRRPLVVESVTHRVTVRFEVRGMTPFDDFDDFGFEAVYEFQPISLCDANIQKRNGSSEGEVIFRVPSTVEGRAMPLRCRWLLEAPPRKYLYLRFKGMDGSMDGCNNPTGNRIIVYSSLTLAPIIVVCLGSGPGSRTTASISGAESASSVGGTTNYNGHLHREVDVFSNYWYNDTTDPQVLRDHVYIEVLASHADTVRFGWIEVTKPYPGGGGRTRLSSSASCPFECPELNACIGAELWCDGRKHCPSGYDEAPAHCEKFPTPYVAAGASAGVVLLLALLALVTIRCRRRNDFKESQPVPTDDFPMDSPHV